MQTVISRNEDTESGYNYETNEEDSEDLTKACLLHMLAGRKAGTKALKITVPNNIAEAYFDALFA